MKGTETFTESREMEIAYNLIANTNISFFLTGRAGTGKSTFLKKIQESVPKSFIVLTPSGVAAVNANGQTIHSFFGLDRSVLGPMSFGRMTGRKIAIARSIDTIIVDEVSMVRCDVVDAMDRMLRYCRKSSRPFGGVQMVFVGDLFQLPPVVTAEDAVILSQIYGKDGYFFYKAHCLSMNPLPKVEFRTIFRQTDREFINILERFRVGTATYRDIALINSRVSADSHDNLRITLTAYRNDARIINEKRLSAINMPAFCYSAKYEGRSEKLHDIVDNELILKEGAQVMFLRNDPSGRWHNGSIAKVKSLKEDTIVVEIGGNSFEIQEEEWEATEYDYDTVAKRCVKHVVGSVRQYPLRLAWAITIHKSQSLTFDKVAIDFGRGAFTFGQAYVALSRCRSLEGLRMVRKLDYGSVRVSSDVLHFTAGCNNETVLADEISIGEAVNSFEQKGDYDGAAVKLFDMCDIAAHKGQPRHAYELFCKAMGHVADDTCLFGRRWEPIEGSCIESAIVNGAGMLYSGKTDEAIRILSCAVRLDERNFNGLYLLARAYEAKGCWEALEDYYAEMASICSDTVNNGMDSPDFRKFRYRLAIMNESHYGDDGIRLIANLIDENPLYDRYHSDLRWMLRNHKDSIFQDDPDKGTLMAVLLDGDIEEDTFLDSIRKERDESSDIWNEYLDTIADIASNLADDNRQ